VECRHGGVHNATICESEVNSVLVELEAAHSALHFGLTDQVEDVSLHIPYERKGLCATMKYVLELAPSPYSKVSIV
jgi:hypothetical protein